MTPPPLLSGADVLRQVLAFLARFVAYPSEAARIAHVLWIAHTWLMDRWESTPRIAFLSPEPGSGKTRALEVTEPLVPRPVHAVNTTPAYLFRKVSDPEGPPTILFDEADSVFGPKAKDNEDVRGMLNAGHRRGAKAGRCVMKGKTVETEELDAYCAVALAGLDDLPDTIATRAVLVRMRRRGPGERIEPWRQRINSEEAKRIADQLAAWAASAPSWINWPDMPDGIEDRNADVWEPLLAVADLAGEEWPERARCAAVTLVTDKSGDTQSLGVQLLADLRTVFGDNPVMRSDDILSALLKIEESPWGDLHGRELNARGLAQRLRKYELKPGSVRFGNGTTAKGYKATDLADVWARYLPIEEKKDGADQPTTTAQNTVTSVTPSQQTAATATLTPQKSVTSVTPSQDNSNGYPPCRKCGDPLMAPASRKRRYCEKCYLEAKRNETLDDLLDQAEATS